MEIAGNLFAEVGSQFYGMLLTTKGSKTARTIFNPLHPVIVAELKKEDSNFNLDKQEWSISIYSFKDDSYKKYEDNRNKENYIDEIATIVTSINSPANYIIENSNFNVDIKNDRFILNYVETKRERSSGDIINLGNSEDRNYIIPSQIINIRGVAYPYYGTTYSRRGLAWNLSPMYAANINHPNGQSTKDGMAGGSRICTHSGNSKTQMGLSSLNHCNTTSPLNSYLLTEGSMTYAEQSMKAGLEMFLGDAFIEHGTMEARVLTYQEFLTENGGNGTRKLYLRYLKDRLDSKMDEKPIKVVAEPVTPKYPYHDEGKEYQTGDIVIDKGMETNEFGGLRIYNINGDGYWTNYIEPTPVVAEPYGTGTNRVNNDNGRIIDVIETEAQDEAALAQADINEEIEAHEMTTFTAWVPIEQYNIGDEVVHNGNLYRATINALQLEPGTTNMWEIVPANEQELAEQQDREIRQDMQNEQVVA